MTPKPLITGTDFITVATKDFDAAVGFYGGVLGLPEAKRWGEMPAVEFETGNLTIAVMQSDAFGLEFRANNHPIELRVDDFLAAQEELDRAASSSGARPSTPASVARPSSRTRTATCWRSTTATRPARPRSRPRTRRTVVIRIAPCPRRAIPRRRRARPTA